MERRKKKMNCGIDLGTTNSAVAVVKNGDTIVCKNLEQAEVTPSVVYIDKKGKIRVGRSAYNRLIADPDNAAAEFKRAMGYKEIKHFLASGKKLTPEELSAEVLKSLLNDAYRTTGEDVTHAVIGVPAAFGQLQCEATRSAAELAGLKNVIFLQEPIAAAVAYGFDRSAQNQRWIVYDLGGGTFDAAVVSTYDDKLTVLAHQGNNALGGKDFDDLIIKNIFYPFLSEDYKLPEMGSESFLGLYQELKRIAEEVKIILSQTEETVASIFDVGADLEGKEIELEINVTRRQLERLVADKIEETIILCQKALKEARLEPSDLNRIILVGGATYMPVVRKYLAEAFNLPLSFSIDPMTVVARGAALYAAAQRWEIEEEKKAANEKLSIKLEYPSPWPHEECYISGKIEETNFFNPARIQLMIQAEGGVWNSGWFTTKEDGFFEVEVRLLQDSNYFFIYCRNENGKIIETQPDSFFIIKAPTIDEPPLPHTLFVELLTEEENTEFEPIFKKGIRLPAEKTIICRAAKTLYPSSFREDALNIKLFEGERQNAFSNEWIGTLKISSEEIIRKIHEGSEIELHFEIDQNRKLTVTAFVPLLDQWFTENIYIPEKRTAKETLEIISEELDEQLAELEEMRRKAIIEKDEKTIEEIETCISRGEQLQEDVYSSEQSKSDETHLISEIKGFLGQTAEISDVLSFEKSEENYSIYSSLLPKIEELLEEIGEKNDEEEFEFLKKCYEKAEIRNDLKALRRSEKDIKSLYNKLIQRRPDFWYQHYDYLSRPGMRYVNKTLATKKLKEGKEAREDNDLEKLKKIVIELYELLDIEEKEKAAESKQPPGIRRQL